MTGDLFEGTWRAMNDKSSWDPAYTPEQACMRFETTDTGDLPWRTESRTVRPAPNVPPQSHRTDDAGRLSIWEAVRFRVFHPVPWRSESQPDSRTLEAGAEVDGKVLGKGTYKVSEDGRTLTVTAEGIGLKGPFKTVAIFERVVPDPLYVPQGDMNG